MLNKKVHLSKNVFEKDVEQVPIRQGYGEGLLAAGKDDERVVALCADLTASTKTAIFSKEFPERFVQMGVAEQSMASVASGMAAMGKIPFLASYAMFSPGRNWEQIRTTICYNNRNVKIAGAHAGISVGPDGGTHQAIEDIAITRVIPRMTVIVPCDATEARKATIALAKMEGPAYLRLAREKTPVMTTDKSPFEIGRTEVFWESKDPEVAIIACGALVYNALVAARELEEDGTHTIVLNNHTVKPMDEEAIYAVAKKTGAVVTVEEHQIAGGMGSAVAEILSQKHPVPIEFVGVHDKFGQSGEPDELIKHYGMDKDAIVKAVKKVISRK
ncbi:transketolase family protein [Patescibacteria group bacterium]|nr:transketolase family protein [Patescibacteria group bacterium]